MTGEGNPLAIDESYADAADRPREGKPSDLGRRRCRIDRENVVQVIGVERQHGDDDLDLVAQTLNEGRTQGTIDEPAGEDRVLGRTALATEE